MDTRAGTVVYKEIANIKSFTVGLSLFCFSFDKADHFHQHGAFHCHLLVYFHYNYCMICDFNKPVNSSHKILSTVVPTITITISMARPIRHSLHQFEDRKVANNCY